MLPFKKKSVILFLLLKWITSPLPIDLYLSSFWLTLFASSLRITYQPLLTHWQKYFLRSFPYLSDHILYGYCPLDMLVEGHCETSNTVGIKIEWWESYLGGEFLWRRNCSNISTIIFWENCKIEIYIIF